MYLWFGSALASCFFVSAVMDITDIAHGKTDDDDKQYFIPFQQWVCPLWDYNILHLHDCSFCFHVFFVLFMNYCPSHTVTPRLYFYSHFFLQFCPSPLGLSFSRIAMETYIRQRQLIMSPLIPSRVIGENEPLVAVFNKVIATREVNHKGQGKSRPIGQKINLCSCVFVSGEECDLVEVSWLLFEHLESLREWKQDHFDIVKLICIETEWDVKMHVLRDVSAVNLNIIQF